MNESNVPTVFFLWDTTQYIFIQIHNLYANIFPKAEKATPEEIRTLNSPTKTTVEAVEKMARTSTCKEEGPRRHNLQQNPQRQYPQNNKRALQIISYKFPHSRAISGGLGGARLANSRQNSHHRAPLPFKCPRRVVPAPSTSCRKCQPLGSYRRAFTMCIKWCL